MDICDHSWFTVIDIQKLVKRRIPAPWIPKRRNLLDASNYESYRHFENESMALQPCLTKSHQDLFTEF